MKSIRKMTQIGIVAAMYVVLTLVLGEFGFGMIQFRISEVLNLLAFISPIYVYALTLGCMIVNSTYSLVDVIVGGLTTFITTYMIYQSKNLFKASLWPLLNGPVLALEFYLVFQMNFWVTMVSITLSQAVVMLLIAYPLFKKIFKNKVFLQKLGASNEVIIKKGL